jgi:poly(3-hydroxybutyrate) depolymerase
MQKVLLACAAAAFAAVALVAAQQAYAARQNPPGTYETTPVGQFAFFPASQPANSTHVGIFVARRLPQKAPELFYCSSPSNAGAQEKTDCRPINAFPK